MEKLAFIIGHSHLKSVVDCLFPRPGDPVSDAAPIVYNVFDTGRFGADFQFSVNGEGRLVLNPLLVEAIKRRLPEAGETILISMFGGNAHNAFSLLQHPRPFDFFLPEAPDLEPQPGAEIVSYDFVYRTLYRYTELYLVNMATLAQTGLGRTFQIESPPPVGDDAYVAEHLEAYFKTVEERPALSPPLLRYKLWRVHSNIVRDACAANGIDFVPAPAAGMDGRYLARDSYSGDSTHASATYGGHILRQIEKRLGARYNGWQWLY